MYDSQPGYPGRREDPQVDAAKLWSGGVATACVAALIAIVGDLIARGVLDIPVLAPASHGTWHTASVLPYAIAAAVGALIATGLMHALALTTPRPSMFFGWILFLVGVVVTVWPFTTGADLDAKLATAVLDVVIVLAIWSLVDGTARRTVRLPGR